MLNSEKTTQSTCPRIIPELEEIKVDGVKVNYEKFEVGEEDMMKGENDD